MIEELRPQIARLIALYEQQKQRADALNGRVQELESRIAAKDAELNDCQSQITELNLQIDNLRLMSAFGAVVDKEEAQATLDKLIGEIDKCIKLLDN